MEHQDRDSVRDVWGNRTPFRGEWPGRVDEHLDEEPDRWVPSACVLCSNGCALDIGVRDGKIVGVRGRESDRVNRGRLGPKGLHGWVANNSPDRLTRPLVRENGQLRPASWEEAMSLLVTRSKEIRDRYTGGAIAFYNTFFGLSVAVVTIFAYMLIAGRQGRLLSVMETATARLIDCLASHRPAGTAR